MSRCKQVKCPGPMSQTVLVIVMVFANIFTMCKSGSGFPDNSVGIDSICNAGNPSSIPVLGRSTGEGIGYPLQYSWASLVAQTVKRICLGCGRPGFNPWVGKIPWRRAWQSTVIVLPGESPWTEEPGGLQSTGSQIARCD